MDVWLQYMGTVLFVQIFSHLIYNYVHIKLKLNLLQQLRNIYMQKGLKTSSLRKHAYSNI